MKKYIAPFFFVAVIGNVQAAEITETHVTGTRFKFTTKLDAPLIAGNKVKIEFGKNLVPMTCVETTCTLFRTMNSDVMPTYKIGIYNSKNVLQSTNLEANSITNLPVYTKIANDGSELPDSAQLGTNPKDWACTKDNKTGLIWEVKTDDSGLRDKDWSYSWYEPDSTKNGGSVGYENGNMDIEWCKGCDTYAYTAEVNIQTLCNSSNWRLPTDRELASILKLSPYNPKIDTTYFPNTVSNTFWSSTAYAYRSSLVQIVNFYSGNFGADEKSSRLSIRLVSNTK